VIDGDRTFSHAIFDTRFGPAAIAGTDRGVIHCALPAEDPDEMVGAVAVATGLAPREAGDDLDPAIAAIGAFLAGGSDRIEIDLDWRLCSGFTRRILEATMDIPYGETLSYGELAIEAGHPGAHRAAGSALSRNPFALIVPCHRVVRADGDPGDYGRGERGRRLKRALLDLESGHA
jgi:methylated-DNA-[protein]-cysteine S-methyltransferase